MKQPAPILTLQNLRLGYGLQSTHQVVADSLNEAVEAQEMIALIGPNGTGKSTLLRTLAKMQKPLDGTINLLGTNISHLSAKEIARDISVILTDRADVGYIKAADVVAMGRFPHTGWFGFLSDSDRQKIDQAITFTHIEQLLNKSLHQLSDGERQKVMIARALAQDTPLMLLDEPTTHLDIANRVSIIRLLRTLTLNAGKTIIFSTHDIELALQVADRIWLMHDQSLVSGAPEDMVLTGKLTQVMGSDVAPFDLHTGTFRIQPSGQQIIGLQGSGSSAYWTQRALERIGYQVRSSAAIMVRVSEEGEWKLSKGEQLCRCHSIEELISILKHTHPIIAPVT
uniref:ABC transporter ATP-binding protein n=1 Tax=Roseihalotalea indica TaxID=2867963 RepID=A0AA49JCX8_9BACT|nr:ABC transporter ATP-binding protein [Tunicatimonas sp. TK19036]